MKASVLALFVACLGIAPLSAQQVYTWTDANGVKHFSDTPPPASVKESKKLDVRNREASDDGSPEEAAAAAKDGPKLAAAAGYSADDIKRNCEVARKNSDTLEKSRPAEGADADAQVTFQQNLSKVQDQLKLFCG